MIKGSGLGGVSGRNIVSKLMRIIRQLVGVGSIDGDQQELWKFLWSWKSSIFLKSKRKLSIQHPSSDLDLS